MEVCCIQGRHLSWGTEASLSSGFEMGSLRIRLWKSLQSHQRKNPDDLMTHSIQIEGSQTNKSISTYFILFGRKKTFS